jgi:hypothetical protein
MDKSNDLIELYWHNLEHIYVGEHQNDWDLYHEALTFAYNTQVHTSTGISPFELTLSRPPTPMAMEPVAAIQSNNNPTSKSGTGTLVGGPRGRRAEFVKRIEALVPRIREAIARAGERYVQA